MSAMRIIARNKLVEFWKKHPDTVASLTHWYDVTKAAAWGSPLDAVKDFSTAKALNGERVRFEVSGGNYRLIVAFDWNRAIAFIKFIGTHAEYDKVDALTVKSF
jgi:mRNA interferase HigB